MRRRPVVVAQGLYLALSGLWPLVHYRSFERVTGPKKDEWLVQTVAGLAVTAGGALLHAGKSHESLEVARTIGIGSALTFGAIDTIYGATGRIRRVYLADAIVEAFWLAAWARQRDHASYAHRYPHPQVDTALLDARNDRA